MLAKLAGMLNKTTQLTFYVLLMISLDACQAFTPEKPLVSQVHSTILAKVGSQIITQADVDAELRALPQQIQEDVQTRSYQQSILQTLIRRAVLTQRAKDMALDNNPDIRHQIERNRDSILIEALRHWKIKQIPTPKATAISNYYQQHLEDFTTPEQVHARHILVRSQKKAQWIYKQLIHKKDNFKHLVALYSLDDSTQSLDGDLNWFSRGIMVPAFEKAVFSLKEAGDISHPVQTKFGWHIIELLDHHLASQARLAHVHDDIVQILRQKKLDQWMNDLVKESHPQQFDTIKPQP